MTAQPAPARDSDSDGDSLRSLSGSGIGWTSEQLAVVLSVLFGQGARGGPDTAKAAAGLGVGRRSVQRWLRATPEGQPAIPVARLATVRSLAVPDPEVMARERVQATYAREAIRAVALPNQRGVLPAWKSQRWLDQHLVLVTEWQLGISQVGFTRSDSRHRERGRPEGASVLQFCVLPTRFHAQLLVHGLLTELETWRIRGGALAPAQGGNQMWLPGAPEVDLGGLAVRLQLR